MDSMEFAMKCRPHNIKYMELFDDVPCIQDYYATQEEFFNALLKSIEEKKPIDEYLTKSTYPEGDDILI